MVNSKALLSVISHKSIMLSRTFFASVAFMTFTEIVYQINFIKSDPLKCN